MPRRMRFIVFIGVVTMLILATGIAAGAQPEGDIQSTEAEIAEAQDRLMEIRSEESDALADYNIALHKMNESNGEIADAEKDLQAAEEDLAEAQTALEERASQVYRSGNVGFVDVLVGVDDFSQFASRVDLWMRLLEEERAAYEAVLEAKNEIEERKSELETERARRVEAVEEALDHKDQVAESEAESEAYLGSLNSDLQAAIEAEQQRAAAGEGEALRQHLANESPRRAAERRADGELALARRGADEQQIGDVRAGDEEDEEHRARERRDRRPHTLDEVVVHRHDVEVRVGGLHDREPLAQVGGHALGLGLGLLHRGAGLEPPDHP